jgi:hypothetical protein
MTATLTDAQEQKRLATVIAQLALKGFQVHPLATGGFFCAKWNLTKYCAALDDLEAFARQVGARG